MNNTQSVARPYWIRSPVALGWVLESAVRHQVAHVRGAYTEYDPHEGHVRLIVRMKWYAYLTCGVLHVRTWKKAREIADFVSKEWLQVKVIVL